MINECINLSMKLLSGNIKLTEDAGSRKDRYTVVSYANFFASLYDKDLIREIDEEDEFEVWAQNSFFG